MTKSMYRNAVDQCIEMQLCNFFIKFKNLHVKKFVILESDIFL